MPRRRRDIDGKEILTFREQLLIEGVWQGKSITEAGLDAGYSPRSAAQNASETLKKPEIQRAVQDRIQNVVKADTDEVLQLFAAHLRGDVADFADLFLDDGRIDLKKAKEIGISRLIKKLDYEPIELVAVDKEGKKTFVTRYRCKVEFHDSQSAASKLADIMGIKQQPRANEHDVDLRQQGREEALKALAELVLACNGDESRARELLAENAPTLSRYIN